MKKFLFAIVALFLFSFAAEAQVPQSVCYQAVATDQSGRELVSQNIKVRISLLKGSAGGVDEWVETHTLTTDGFGLFDLQIGNGTRIGGVQTSFSNVRWSQDKFYLKVEMDISGGNNFVLMGTNQLVSVPYALFTEKAAFASVADSSSRAGRATVATTAETATYATKAGSATTAETAAYATKAGKADEATKALQANYATTATYADSSRFSQNSANAVKALKADEAVRANQANSATTSMYSDSSRFSQNSATAQRAVKADTASFSYYADSARRAGQAQRAIIADSTLRAQIAWNAVNANHAIVADSASKAIFAWRALKADTALVAKTASDDFDRDPKNEIQSLTFRRDTLSLSNPSGTPYSIALSSIPLRAPAASIDFPSGIVGDPIVITSNFVVPVGKSLFVSAVNSSVKLADGKILYAEPGMPMIPSGTTISTCYCTGFLIAEQPEIKTMILDFTNPAYEYVVPTGFTLIIKSGKTERGLLDLQLDSDIFNFYTVNSSQSARLIVINAGKRIKKPYTILPTDALVLTGYLLKNN